MPYVSKPMKLVTVWFTEEEKAFLDELAKAEDVTLSKALRGERSCTSRTRRRRSAPASGWKLGVVRVGKAVPKPLDLPQLLDCRGIKDELGVTRAAAEAIMRQLPKVVVPGLRKVYVRREDVLRLVDQSTMAA